MVKKSLKLLSLLLVFSLISPVGFVFSQATLLSGTISLVEPLGAGQYRLTLETTSGIKSLILDSSTLIQMITQANEVSVGEEILTVPKSGKPRVKTSPFKNMPSAVRKALGLPDIPDIPDVPSVPQIPKVPQVPAAMKKMDAVPNVPQVPKLPNVPKAPQKPGKPGGGSGPGASQPAASGGAGGGSQAPLGGAGQAPGGAGGDAGEEGSSRQEVPDVPEPPKEASSSAITPEVISKATPTIERIHGKRIRDLRSTPQGIELELEGRDGKAETIQLSPEDKVLRMLEAADLKPDMLVKLEVLETESGTYAQRVTVI